MLSPADQTNILQKLALNSIRYTISIRNVIIMVQQLLHTVFVGLVVFLQCKKGPVLLYLTETSYFAKKKTFSKQTKTGRTLATLPSEIINKIKKIYRRKHNEHVKALESGLHYIISIVRKKYMYVNVNVAGI